MVLEPDSNRRLQVKKAHLKQVYFLPPIHKIKVVMGCSHIYLMDLLRILKRHLIAHMDLMR